MCGCDFGTETTATGTGGTLCELHEREDCSACDDGYYISATAATGAQTCTGRCCLHNYVVWCAVCVRVRVCALESSPLFLALPLIVLCVALCVCMCLEPEPEPYTTF